MYIEKIVISENSFDGEEFKFAEWLKRKYPTTEIDIDNTLDSGCYINEDEPDHQLYKALCDEFASN